MESYEGHERDDSSLFNRKHKKFFEDVLLPSLRDELDSQRQLLIHSLREHGLNMLPLPQKDHWTIIEPDQQEPNKKTSLHSKEATPQEDPTGDSAPVKVTLSTWLDSPSSMVHARNMADEAAHNFFHVTQARLQEAIRSTPFRAVMCLLIAANSVLIGIQTQEQFVAARDGVAFDGEHTWNIVETIFATIFLVELLLRVCADGGYFFTGEDRFWNLFDAMLVAQAWVNVLSEGVFLWFLAPNYSFLRVVRVIRVLRLLRMLRVMRNMRSVRIMVVSLASSLQSLLWALLMLVFVIYLFSIIILHCLLGEVGQSGQQLRDVYGDLPQTILSLFMAITGGKDWADFYTPLANVHGPYGLIFLCYIYFSVFGVLNVVTSVFADSVNSASVRDLTYAIDCENDRREEYVEACRSFFYAVDTDRSGRMSWKKLRRYLCAKENEAHLAILEIDESQAYALYTRMDVNGENSVDIEDFVQGCVRLKGPAKAMDLSKLSDQNAKFMSQWKEFTDFVQEKLEAIDRQVAAMPTRTIAVTVPDAVPDRMSRSTCGHLVL